MHRACTPYSSEEFDCGDEKPIESESHGYLASSKRLHTPIERGFYDRS